MTGRWADGSLPLWPVGVAAGQLELTGRRGRRRAWQIGRFELTCSLALTLTAGQATSSLARHLLVTLYADGPLPLWPIGPSCFSATGLRLFVIQPRKLKLQVSRQKAVLIEEVLFWGFTNTVATAGSHSYHWHVTMRWWTNSIGVGIFDRRSAS